MKKQSKIKNLIVAPLIASAIFLSSSSAFASSPIQRNQAEVHNISNTENAGDTKKGITGIVIKTNGSIIVVSTKDDTEYTVDASGALIMKEGAQPNENPAIVGTTDIQIGDAIMVRGEIKDGEF
jgi:hypothetical protein